jgi:hypothetical protein
LVGGLAALLRSLLLAQSPRELLIALRLWWLVGMYGESLAGFGCADRVLAFLNLQGVEHGAQRSQAGRQNRQR